MNLPLFELLINEDEGSELAVNYVALVEKPAIERDFMAFNKDEPRGMKFAAVDEERRIISGPAMIADMPIYRKDDDGTEYFVVFKSPTIQAIAQKFFAKSFHQNVNIMHDPTQQVGGVTVFESFIVDAARGIQPMKGFEDVAQGSWFISAKVNNEGVWDQVKVGNIKGFSVEGIFGYKKKPTPEEAAFGEIISLLNRISV
jgi:hypothetical protein